MNKKANNHFLAKYANTIREEFNKQVDKEISTMKRRNTLRQARDSALAHGLTMTAFSGLADSLGQATRVLPPSSATDVFRRAGTWGAAAALVGAGTGAYRASKQNKVLDAQAKYLKRNGLY